ncbi:MAG: hypothetical protein JNK37_23105 [Verrucomicrobiales bacterium]|nr:hypothetical protein [Verrucomicrobiales bacterium]
MQTITTVLGWLAVAMMGGLGLGSIQADEPPATALEAVGQERPAGILRTVDGRLYLGIREAKADETGLTFRHQGGAARVSRERLSVADQKRFGLPPMEPPAEPAVADPPSGPTTATWPPLVLSYRVSVSLPLPFTTPANDVTSCGATLAARSWPSYWARPHYGLAYPLFPCRQAAERDFLITTGLLPRPVGIVPWRLR